MADFLKNRLKSFVKKYKDMYYTVSDFYNTYKDSMKMVCGKGGLSRRVSSVGILDYEFLPEISGKYKHYNFDENQLVVSTLMYARENPGLISDAIRELISVGVSGLVIKDIFRVKIPETMIRYAEARNFPIFIFDSKEPFIEDLIFNVKTGILRQESTSRVSRELDFITSESSGEQDIYEHARLINPSFETQHKVYYIMHGGSLKEDTLAESLRNYVGSPLDNPESLLASYEGGLLYITTWEHKPGLKDSTIIDALTSELGTPGSSIGISDTHYYLGELGYSIKEAMYAAYQAYHSRPGTSLNYSDLGLLRIVFPQSDKRVMREFSRSILEPIQDFDLENNGKLMETLSAWSESGMSFTRAADKLHQHENTLRYRMDKIGQITGLDFKKAEDAQQLNLAYLIDYCTELKDKH